MLGMLSRVLVSPYPDIRAGRQKVSTTNGGDMVWARSSRELFLIVGTGVGNMHGVPVQPGRPIVVGRETDLFDARPYFPTSGVGTDYDTAPDGRFLMITRGQATSITVVTHWTDALERRVR
jgi:hypothetical protein